MRTRVQILVSGRVQGVCFRDFTQREAAALGLTGWVKNLSDGRVEAVAEGEKELLENFIARIKQGPALSRVDGVDLTWSEWQGEYSDFRITW